MLEEEAGPNDEGNCRSYKGTVLGWGSAETEARIWVEVVYLEGGSRKHGEGMGK